MIEIGNLIPKVNGLDQLGETIHLADHKGKKTVIYFYYSPNNNYKFYFKIIISF